MIFETLDKRPVYTIMVLRDDDKEPEFVEVCGLPARHRVRCPHRQVKGGKKKAPRNSAPFSLKF